MELTEGTTDGRPPGAGDYVDVEVTRWVDGHRLVYVRDHVERSGLVALRIEEELLAGELASWIVTASPRPWQTDTPGANVPGQHDPT